MSSDASLLTLLAHYFPDVSQQDWKIAPLEGLSGGTYLLESQRLGSIVRVIARTNGKQQSSLFIDRSKEAKVLKQLQYVAFSPKFIGKNSTWLLLTWQEGSHPDDTLFLSPAYQLRLAGIVAKLHCQPLFGHRLQLRDEFAHYGDCIDRKRQSPRWHSLHRYFLSARMPKVLKLAPAHLDIHPGNIINGHQGNIILLDWEYAANADIGFSLETYFQFNRLGAAQKSHFLTQYCDKFGAYKDKKRLAYKCNQWSPWVKYMMLMWYEVQWNESHNPKYLLQSDPLRRYFNLIG